MSVEKDLWNHIGNMERRIRFLEANAEGGGGITFVPLTTLATSTDWDGDAKDGADGIIDLSAAFGLPAGIKAVAAIISAYSATTNHGFALGPSSTQKYAIQARTQVSNVLSDVAGIVPCDANGDIYFSQQAALGGVWITITGYWL